MKHVLEVLEFLGGWLLVSVIVGLLVGSFLRVGSGVPEQCEKEGGGE